MSNLGYRQTQSIDFINSNSQRHNRLMIHSRASSPMRPPPPQNQLDGRLTSEGAGLGADVKQKHQKNLYDSPKSLTSPDLRSAPGSAKLPSYEQATMLSLSSTSSSSNLCLSPQTDNPMSHLPDLSYYQLPPPPPPQALHQSSPTGVCSNQPLARRPRRPLPEIPRNPPEKSRNPLGSFQDLQHLQRPAAPPAPAPAVHFTQPLRRPLKPLPEIPKSIPKRLDNDHTGGRTIDESDRQTRALRPSFNRRGSSWAKKLSTITDSVFGKQPTNKLKKPRPQSDHGRNRGRAQETYARAIKYPFEEDGRQQRFTSRPPLSTRNRYKSQRTQSLNATQSYPTQNSRPYAFDDDPQSPKKYQSLVQLELIRSNL